jgi:hypothetical protein
VSAAVPWNDGSILGTQLNGGWVGWMGCVLRQAEEEQSHRQASSAVAHETSKPSRSSGGEKKEKKASKKGGKKKGKKGRSADPEAADQLSELPGGFAAQPGGDNVSASETDMSASDAEEGTERDDSR